MSDNGEYVPFAPVKGVYEANDRGMTVHRVLQAFQGMFGIPPAIVRTVFRDQLKKVVAEEYPNFRCSAARAVLEGRVKGIPKPVDPIHPAWKKRVQQALYLLDLMETMCCRMVEDSIHEQSTEVRREIRDVRKSVGSVKVPRLMQAVYELEKKESKKKSLVKEVFGPAFEGEKRGRSGEGKTLRGSGEGKAKVKKGRKGKKEAQEVPV